MGEELIKKLVNSMNNETKDGLKNITAMFLISIFIVFIILFVKPIYIINVSLNSVEFPQWLLLIFASIVVYVVNIIIFSSDILYYGRNNKNKYIEAFQHKWPSRFIMNEYKLSEEDATYKWFIEFNKWKETTHEMNQLRMSTFARGFSCRLVYYIIMISKGFFITSLLMLIVELVLRNWFLLNIIGKESFLVRVLFCLAMVCILVICCVMNSPKKKNGVWARFDENNSIIIAWIREHKEIFKNAKS